MISLPIDKHLAAITDLIQNNPNVVICSTPGSGKSTRIPAALIKQGSKKILVLQPRRIAAVSLAERIASENGWQLGNEVGYQVRFENRTNSNTGLIFLTEALLLKKLMADPKLSEVDTVILDEFHERSIHSDLALALLFELQMLDRPDLKIVVMSATIQTDLLSQYLSNCPVYEIKEHIYKLEIVKSKESQLVRSDFNFSQTLFKQIKDIITKNAKGKSYLIFLPGKNEIDFLFQLMEKSEICSAFKLFKLHGQIELGQQKEAMTSIVPKIVLTTNIAESSVTVNGINAVIDSGLQRIIRYNPLSDQESLVLERISKASAIQRAGRANRLGEGTCFQLWTHLDERSFPEYNEADINRIDLSDSLLMLSFFGHTDYLKLSWFEIPDGRLLQMGIKKLQVGSLITKENQITEKGKRSIQLPLPNRFAQFLLMAEENMILKSGIKSVLFLENTRSTTSETPYYQCDLLNFLDQRLDQRQQKTFDQLLSLFKTAPAKSSSKDPDPRDRFFSEEFVEIFQKTVLVSFKDRLAKKRTDSESAVLLNGKGIKLKTKLNLEYFVALQMLELEKGDPVCTIVSSVPKELIKKSYVKELTKRSELSFNEKLLQFEFSEATYLESLLIDQHQSRKAYPDEIKEHLTEYLSKNWVSLLKAYPKAEQPFLRIAIAESINGQTILPREKLKQLIELAAYGESDIKTVMEKNWFSFFQQIFEKSDLDFLNDQLPNHFIAPTGSSIAINYQLDKNPHCEVRIQELFGMKLFPKLAGGKLNLTFHLLAPNYRPIQITEDLESFWKNTYPEIRRQYKIKYPKHSWPENPLIAEPVARGPSRKR